MKETFVLAACGDAHVADANQALAYLKRYCRSEMVVLTARSDAPVEHDQVIRCSCPPELSDVEVSRYLKTGLGRLLGSLDGLYCYLDNDVLAVSPLAASIFTHFRPPISFALDQSGKVTVASFSPWALRSGDLKETIAAKFGVAVEAQWQIWNGGLFLFDRGSTAFLDTWHQLTLAAFADPQWHTRDQGTLIATVWKHRLERHPTLPDIFNWMPRHSPGELDFSRLGFVHFIDGYNDLEWPEWLLTRDLLPRTNEG